MKKLFSLLLSVVFVGVPCLSFAQAQRTGQTAQQASGTTAVTLPVQENPQNSQLSEGQQNRHVIHLPQKDAPRAGSQNKNKPQEKPKQKPEQEPKQKPQEQRKRSLKQDLLNRKNVDPASPKGQTFQVNDADKAKAPSFNRSALWRAIQEHYMG